MKKLLLSTLSFIVGISSLASALPAMAASELLAPGDPLMTIDEILELRATFDAEVIATCTDSSDWNCARNFIEERRYTDSRYNALENYLRYSFVVSSINPGERTMRFIYNNKDYEMMGYSGLQEHTLKELRLGWSESGSPYIYFMEGNIPKDESAAPAYFHYLYNGNEEKDGANWITPYTEFTTTWQDPGFETANSGAIQYFMVSSADPISGGAISVLDCLNSRFYQTGMECRATFSKNSGSLLYLPYLNGVPAWPYAYSSEVAGSESEITAPSDTATVGPSSEVGESNSVTTDSVVTESGDLSTLSPDNSATTGNSGAPASESEETIDLGTAAEQNSTEALQTVAVGDLGQFTAEPAITYVDGEAEKKNDRILWCIVAWLALVPITIFFGIKRPEKRF